MALRPDDPALLELLIRYLREPAYWDANGSPVFVPALTTAEQATLADLQLMVKFAISANLTLAEFQAMKPDLATGKTYLGLASPTNAQTVAAVKAIIRVLGDLLRS